MQDPKYREALGVCLNAIPLEESAITRRPGSRFIAFTKAGQPAAIWKFGFTAAAPYNMEFTAGFLRLSYGPALVLEPTTQSVTSFSGANPSLVTTGTAHGWSSNDEVQFSLPAGDVTDFGTASLLNRQFLIQVQSASTFTIFDSVTGATIDGSTLSLGPGGMQVSRVLRFSTPYLASELNQIRIVQAINNEQNQVFILHPNHQPLVLTAVSNPDQALNIFATFSLTPAVFIDGPYLDPPADGATLTPSAKTGVITLTVGLNAWSSTTTYGIGDTVSFSGIGYISLVDSNLNNEPDISTADWQPESAGADVSASGFQNSDIGRSIRLFSEPANWVSTTAYTTGQAVKFDGSYWTALQNSTGKKPGLDVVNWAPDASAAVWSWGRIQTVSSATVVTLQLLGGALLYTTPIVTWQMGRYSNTTGWPTNGVYEEGRLWLVGLEGNHFDGSMTNQTLTWSPTGADGTVADNNSIAETLNDKEVNPIFWMLPGAAGLILGTQAGEWSIHASALNDPLTPASIQAQKITHYGQENIQPEHAPLAFLAVQRYGRKLLEIVADPYSGRYSATNISLSAAHLMQDGGGIAQIAYVQERTPILWARLNDGALIGMLYKRDNPFGYNPAQLTAWHQHTLGTGRNVISISGGAAAGGKTDALTLVTQDPVTGLCWLELLTDVFDEDQDITDAWFLDGADLPFLVQLEPVGLNGVRLYGYHYLAGQTVQVWAAGLDMGNIQVAADGHIDVPFGSDPNGLFTLARMEALSLEFEELFPDKASFVSSGGAPIPAEPNVAGLGEFFLGTFNYSTGGIANGTVDWANNLFYIVGTDGTNEGASVYKITTMEPVNSATQTAIMGGQGADQGLGQGVVGQDGFWYFSATSENTGAFAKVSAALTLAGKFGIASGNEGSSNAGIARPASMAAVFAGNQYTVQTSQLSGHALQGGTGTEFCVVDGTHMKFAGSFGGDQSQGVVCAGRQTNDGLGHFYGEAYAVLNNFTVFQQFDLRGQNNQPLGLWRISINENPPSNPTIGYTNLHSITPEQVDPTWHFWSGQTGGVVYDTADGNVITIAQTGDALPWGSGSDLLVHMVRKGSNGHLYICIVALGSGTSDPTTDAGVHWQDKGAFSVPTNTFYVFKINVASGAVMWAIPLASDPTDGQWGTSQISGHVAIHDGTTTMQWIDTIAGTTQVLAIASVQPQGQQRYGPLGLLTAVNFVNPITSPVAVAPCTGPFTNHWGYFEALPVTPTQLVIPVIAGYTYTTDIQILRPINPQEAGAANGPALGKTRRSHMAAFYLHGAQGVSIGTDFTRMHVCNFKLTADSTILLPITSLYNDIYWDTLEDNYSFNSRPALQVTRPYPMTCLAIEGFLHTSDR